MTPPTLHLEALTWPEVEAALSAGFTTVVVAVGATEQHGPALPLSVDAERGTRLAEEIAGRLGRALVGPTVRVGCSEHHMGFPGTLSVSRTTLEALCSDYCASLAHHGFRDVCLVPSHGGNFVPLTEMVHRLRKRVGPACRVHVWADLIEFARLWKDTTEAVAGLGDRVGAHADIVEASEMLVVRPDLVRRDRAEPGRVGDLTPQLVERLFAEGMRAVSPNGVLGDTRGMSEEIGLATFAAAADMIAEHFKRVME